MQSVLAPAYVVYTRKLLSQISQGPIPRHIGIILDGNRRYAAFKGIDYATAYEQGAKKLEEVLEWCWDLDIKVVSVWVFSTENFNRSKEQVELIMKMAKEKMRKLRENKKTHERKVKVIVSGARDLLPPELIEEIELTERATANYDQRILNILLAYGGRREITDAVKNIARHVKRGDLNPEEISEEIIAKNLYTAGLPDPDLIIRTSGQERLSGFLMWQSAYSEFYFAEVFWPLFRKIDLLRAIRTYQQRTRNFGA